MKWTNSSGESFEARYLRVGAESFDGFQALLVAVAVECYEVALALPLRAARVGLGNHLLVAYLGAAVAHAEEGCLQHVDVAFLYQFGEEL